MVKVCLDAGHYGKYNRSPANGSYYESDMVWTLHLLQKQYLEEYGIEVITTRSTQALDRALYDRGAASKGCDLFVSDHSNAVASGINESVDYPVAFVLLDGSSTEIGLKLAEVIQKVMGTGQKARTATRKGNNGEYYGVLRGAAAVGTPGIILEHSFHTNAKTTNWLLNVSNLRQLAQSEADAIAAYLGVKKREEKALFRVQTGAFTKKVNANTLASELQAEGFDTYIIQADGYYKVQVGAYNQKANADAVLSQLKTKGYEAFITM